VEPLNLKFENFLASIPPLIRNSQLARVAQIELGKLLNIPVYRFMQDDRHAETYNAITGEKISPIDRATATAVAEADFAPDIPVRSVARVEAPGMEYQGSVPTWRVTFDNWKSSSIYVSMHTGQVTARRSAIWRIYDFLWMMHIMDYRGRENFNNWIIRIMSLLGLTTVISGYYLWYLTTPLLESQKKAITSKRRAKPKR
jgi:uncharacterized iron-regulated membrane protein